MNWSCSVRFVLSEVKASLRLALPLITSQLAYAISVFVITIFTAKLGEEALAVVGIISPLWVLFEITAMGILCATSILISQYLGRKNDIAIQHVTSQAILLALIISPLTALMIWWSPVLLNMLPLDHHFKHLAIVYMHSLAWAVIPSGLLVIGEQFLIGLHKTKLVLCISLLQVPFEIVACYAFVFGKFGLPAFGIVGFGYAFLVVYSCAAVLIGLLICFSKTCRPYFRLSDILHWHPQYLRELIRVGWPMGLMGGIELGALSVIAFLMARFGAEALAAHQVARQYFVFVIIVLWGLASATSVRIGYAVGAGDRTALKRIAYTDAGIVLFCLTIISVLYCCFTSFFIGLDVDVNQHVQLARYASHFFIALIFLQIFEGLRMIYISALRGLKDTQMPMLVSFIGFWLIAIPMGYWLSHIEWLSASGLWIGMVLGVGANALILLKRFNRLSETLDLEKLVI